MIGSSTRAALKDIRGRLQASAKDRATLMADIRRLERSLAELEASLEERDSTVGSLTEGLQKSESRVKRFISRVDELENQMLDKERIQRRLERELADEKLKKYLPSLSNAPPSGKVQVSSL